MFSDPKLDHTSHIFGYVPGLHIFLLVCVNFPLNSKRGRWSSGAAVAPGTRPAPPQAHLLTRANAVTPADSALGANVGAGVRTEGCLCRPPLRRGGC